jgi:hypothetical protein
MYVLAGYEQHLFLLNIFICTAKPVKNNHPQDPKKVIVMPMWLLYKRGSYFHQ